MKIIKNNNIKAKPNLIVQPGEPATISVVNDDKTFYKIEMLIDDASSNNVRIGISYCDGVTESTNPQSDPLNAIDCQKQRNMTVVTPLNKTASITMDGTTLDFLVK